MEDTELTTTFGFIGKSCGRRRGFVLPTALIIVLVGAAISVAILSLAHYMHVTDIFSRGSYAIDIDARGLIEQTKGLIVAENIRRSDDLSPQGGTVLHGQGEPVSKDYFTIRGTEDLRVVAAAPLTALLSRDIPLPADRWGSDHVRTFIRLQVFDANYKPQDVKGFVPDADFPPSIMPAAEYASKSLQQWIESYSTENSGASSGSGNVGGSGPGGGGTVNDEKRLSFYRNFGAYLIRADVFREGRARPVRRFEEMFYVMIPSRR